MRVSSRDLVVHSTFPWRRFALSRAVSQRLGERFGVYMTQAGEVRKRLSELSVSLHVHDKDKAAAAAVGGGKASAAGDDLGATDVAERLLHDWAVQLVRRRTKTKTIDGSTRRFLMPLSSVCAGPRGRRQRDVGPPGAGAGPLHARRARL